MKKKDRMIPWSALGLLGAFGLWTAAVCVVDVQPIGPLGSSVGFASLNQWFHGLTGVHWKMYILTDWLSIVPLLIVAGFGLLGLCQWVRRRSIRRVDGSILLLGGFYILVMGAFLLFELVKVNYRPVLIEGVLEASYPSSTTMLALCVMSTAILQIRQRIANRALRGLGCALSGVFALFMVVGRMISGVHWLTDIIGGGLLSGGLVALYRFAVRSKTE